MLAQLGRRAACSVSLPGQPVGDAMPAQQFDFTDKGMELNFLMEQHGALVP